ncbi:MAG: RluA family pseudouridine synthase [Chitinispirillaceae bacterium]|jgi:RluA family pseudouridine synthase|nr:RluA family pseudouridine synthase [Chitinispirillaceae bacterium]
MIEIPAGENEAGSRLDRIVRKALPLMTLTAIYGLIRRGGVRVNGKKAKQDCRIVPGDVIGMDVDASELAKPRQDDGSLANLVKTKYFRRNFVILHEDGQLLACNKPAGLVVHPGTGHLRHDTLLDLATAYLLAGKKIKSPDDIALVHRLDRDTSGVILLGKSRKAVRDLTETFRTRSLEKQYVAICHGRPKDNEGKISLRMSRGRDERGETTMRVDDRGTWSNTRYRIEIAMDDLSRLDIQLDTGKTHQIRVHLAHCGAPIVGDVRYGDRAADRVLYARRPEIRPRLFLHAHKIVLPDGNRRQLVIKAPVPDEFRRIFD